MNHKIEAGFDRALNPGSGKGVIGNGNNLVFARRLRDFFEIDDLKQWVARSFNPNHARVWSDRGIELFRIGKIDVGKVEVRGPTPDFLEKSERAAIEIITDDDVRTAFEQIERCGHRGEARGKGKPTRPTLKVSDAFFVREARWIDGTGVIIALMLSRTFLNVSRRSVNRRHYRAGRGIGYLASMYGAGGKFVLLFHG